MNFFLFTKKDYDYFCEEGMLDDEFKLLLEYKIKGYSIVQIAELLHWSTAKVSVKVKELKDKIKLMI